MPYNGAGVFETLTPPDYPAVAGTTIRAAQFNLSIGDIASGLTQAITRNGQSTIVANLPMWGFRFTGAGDAVNSGDFTTKGQLAATTGITGSGLLGWIQTGTGAVASNLSAKNRQVVNTKDFGALPGNTDAANKVCLQLAIAAVNTAGGGRVVNDFDIDYGLNWRDLATYPSFTGMTTDIVVEDRGNATADGVNKAGAQVRNFTYTAQTAPFGQHDGNYSKVISDWAPGMGVNNTAAILAVGNPGRLATDNRRAYFATYNDGIATWQMGQGTLAGAAITDEVLTNFTIQKFADTGDTLGDYNPYTVERKTGNISYGGGRNVPAAHHHFDAVPASPALNIAMFQSLTTTCSVSIRNSNGVADDVELRNTAGDVSLRITSLGNAITALKANRFVGIGTNAPAYPVEATKANSGDYHSKFENSSATNGYGMNITSGSAAAATFSLLEMYTAGADLKFKFNGLGNGTCDGTWTGGGADRAEMFEWADGNPEGLDGDKSVVGTNRVGRTVTLVNGKIALALPGDEVVGVVSLTYDSLGNANPLNWGKKYLRDDFGLPQYEDYEVMEWEERVCVREAVEPIEPFKTPSGSIDPGREAEPAQYEVTSHSYASDQVPAGMSVPSTAVRVSAKRQVLNPQFSAEQMYLPRTARKEWDAIGILGICRVLKSQPTGRNWIKMRDISALVEEWLVR